MVFILIVLAMLRAMFILKEKMSQKLLKMLNWVMMGLMVFLSMLGKGLY
ncbi:hypothetical protein cco71_08786 [Campylobacter coli 317/04]|nr:hypothetical protein cco71_08786 [Campylobacter coli 317/04]